MGIYDMFYFYISMFCIDICNKPGLAGFFHLVEETGLNPGLNRPGRNRFLPPEVEETGKKWKKRLKCMIK